MYNVSVRAFLNVTTVSVRSLLRVICLSRGSSAGMGIRGMEANPNLVTVTNVEHSMCQRSLGIIGKVKTPKV